MKLTTKFALLAFGIAGSYATYTAKVNQDRYEALDAIAEEVIENSRKFRKESSIGYRLTEQTEAERDIIRAVFKPEDTLFFPFIGLDTDQDQALINYARSANLIISHSILSDPAIVRVPPNIYGFVSSKRENQMYIGAIIDMENYKKQQGVIFKEGHQATSSGIRELLNKLAAHDPEAKFKSEHHTFFFSESGSPALEQRTIKPRPPAP